MKQSPRAQARLEPPARHEPQTWLETFIQECGGVAGTVHYSSGPDELRLGAAVNIPDAVLENIGTIPKGKGMAGSAFAAAENLQWNDFKADKTGCVQSKACLVPGKGAVTLLVSDETGETRAVVGVSFPSEKVLTAAELTRLEEKVPSLPAN